MRENLLRHRNIQLTVNLYRLQKKWYCAIVRRNKCLSVCPRIPQIANGFGGHPSGVVRNRFSEKVNPFIRKKILAVFGRNELIFNQRGRHGCRVDFLQIQGFVLKVERVIIAHLVFLLIDRKRKRGFDSQVLQHVVFVLVINRFVTCHLVRVRLRPFSLVVERLKLHNNKPVRVGRVHFQPTGLHVFIQITNTPKRRHDPFQFGGHPFGVIP